MPISKPWRYFPCLSMFNFMAHHPEDSGAQPGCLLHGIYGLVGFGLIGYYVMLYTVSVIDTGKINPNEQIKIYDQRTAEKKKAEEEIILKEQKHIELYQKVFGMSGYADTNLDTGISFSERVSAYRKMGYVNAFFEGEQFPEPTFEQLEELVKKYESDN